MGFARRLISTYARIGRTYGSWAPSLLSLALVVFLPLGVIDGLVTHLDLESIDLENGVEIAALLLAVVAIITTGLLGEVFYSGAAAVFLTHPRQEGRPSLRQIARQLDYRRLVAVDVVYVAIVLVGLALLVVPGVLAFAWLGLSGPILEIEGRSVRGALARSWALVRGRFWLVFLTLAPIQLVGDSLGKGAAHLIHSLLGESFLGGWLAETAAELAFSPLFAVATVLLALDLIAEKDGTGPALNHSPRRRREAAAA